MKITLTKETVFVDCIIKNVKVRERDVTFHISKLYYKDSKSSITEMILKAIILFIQIIFTKLAHHSFILIIKSNGESQILITNHDVLPFINYI